MYLTHVEGFLVLIEVEGSLGHQCTLSLGEHQHIIVEVRDGDFVVLVLQRGNHLAEDVDGVGDGAAENAGVQVLVGTSHLHLEVAEAAQTRGDGGRVGGNHAGVRHEDNVGFEEFLVLFAEIVQAAATDLLLPFQHELHVAGQLVGLHQILEGLGVHKRLTFVVVGTTCPDLAVLDDRFEGVGLPQFERIDGHHVVVAIDHDGGSGFGDDLLAIDHGVAGGGHHLATVGTGGENEFTPAFRTANHIRLVFFL